MLNPFSWKRQGLPRGLMCEEAALGVRGGTPGGRSFLGKGAGAGMAFTPLEQWIVLVGCMRNGPGWTGKRNWTSMRGALGASAGAPVFTHEHRGVGGVWGGHAAKGTSLRDTGLAGHDGQTEDRSHSREISSELPGSPEEEVAMDLSW